jgi:hypothetical protein
VEGAASRVYWLVQVRGVTWFDVGQSHFFSLPWTGSGFGILPLGGDASTTQPNTIDTHYNSGRTAFQNFLDVLGLNIPAVS